MPPKSKREKSDLPRSTPSVVTLSRSPILTPNWPSITPQIPAADLHFENLLDDQVLLIRHLWPSSLCKTYVKFLSTLPLATTPGKPKRGEAVRVNDRFQVDDASFAERLWSGTALREIVMNAAVNDVQLNVDERMKLWGGDVLGLNANIRVYRYSKGQFFDQHYDESNNIMFPSRDLSDSIPAKTTWTLLLYLTSPATGCEGGETVFYPDPPDKRSPAPAPVIASLEVGTALLHRHGKDCLLHEGREVTTGEKWVIRSDLCVRR